MLRHWLRPGGAAHHRSASVLAFLKDGGETGRSTMFCLKPRIGPPMGNRRIPASQDPSCSPPNAFGGETQGPGFRPTPGTRSSPSQGAVGHPLERQRGSCLQGETQGPVANPREQVLSLTGRDREGLATLRMCLCAKRRGCEGFAARHGSLQPRIPPQRCGVRFGLPLRSQ